jgi:hypothetical protein
MTRVLLLLPAFLASMVTAPAPAAAAGPERGADIVLEKRLTGGEVEPAMPGSEYVVQEGDSISAIFSAAGVPPAMVDDYLPLFMKLNPDLEDPDRIFPGQKVRFPPLPGDLPSPEAALRRSPPPEGPAVSEAGGLPGLGRLRAEGALLPLLESSFDRIGENLNATGTLSLPFSSTGFITLANDRYPLLDLSTGRGLIFDLDGQLSQEWHSRIEEQWPEYRVITVPRSGNFRTLMDSVFHEGGFHSVVRNHPLSIGRGGRFRIVPDFLLAKDAESLLEGTLYLIIVDPPGGEALPPFIKESARKHRIEVVDILPGIEGGRRPDIPAPPESWSGRKFTASDLRVLLGEIAPALGLAVTAHFPLRFAEGGDSGVGLAVEADLLLEGRGRSCPIFFGPIESWVSDILSADGREYLVVTDGDSLEDVLARILALFRFPHSGPKVEFYRPGGRYAIVLPGFYLEGENGPFFLTAEELEAPVSAFLASRGIEVVTCLLPDNTK